MKGRLGRYVRNAMIVAAVGTFISWYLRFGPVLSGTYVPDPNSPSSIVLAYSNPAAELISALAVNALCFAPIIGGVIAVFVGLVVGSRSQEGAADLRREDAPDARSPRLGKRWSDLVLICVAGIAIWGFLYALTPPEDVAEEQDVDLSNAVSYQEYSDENLSFQFPSAWTVVDHTASTVIVGDRDEALSIEWMITEFDMADVFDVELDEEVARIAVQAADAHVREIVEGKGATVVSVRRKPIAHVGPYRVLADTALEVTLRADTDGVLDVAAAVVPSFACGTHRTCTASYFVTNVADLSLVDWAEFEDILATIDFAENQ